MYLYKCIELYFVSPYVVINCSIYTSLRGWSISIDSKFVATKYGRYQLNDQKRRLRNRRKKKKKKN